MTRLLCYLLNFVPPSVLMAQCGTLVFANFWGLLLRFTTRPNVLEGWTECLQFSVVMSLTVPQVILLFPGDDGPPGIECNTVSRFIAYIVINECFLFVICVFNATLLWTIILAVEYLMGLWNP
jgi:hypothetical protein